MKKTLVILAMFAVAFGSIALFAGRHHKGNLEKNPELKQKIDAYKEIEMYPKLLEFKAKIDAGLSQEDLAKLNDLRAKAAEIKSKMMNKRAEIQKMKRSEQDFDKDDVKKEFEPMKSEFKEIGEELKDLGKRNEELIMSIAEEAKPFAEKWRGDIKEIIKDYSEKKEHKNKHEDKMFQGKRAIAMLLLFDGELNDDLMNFESKVYPNPLTQSTAIEFDLPKKDDVMIIITDQNGNVVDKITRNNLSEGKNVINWTPKDSQSGTYFYKIEGKNYNSTGQIIINK